MVVCVDTIIAQIDPELAVAENRVAKKGVVNGQGVRDTDAIAGVSAGAIERDDIGGGRRCGAGRCPPPDVGSRDRRDGKPAKNYSPPYRPAVIRPPNVPPDHKVCSTPYIHASG